jgi:hypothetical protein
MSKVLIIVATLLCITNATSWNDILTKGCQAGAVLTGFPQAACYSGKTCQECVDSKIMS